MDFMFFVGGIIVVGIALFFIKQTAQSDVEE